MGKWQPINKQAQNGSDVLIWSEGTGTLLARWCCPDDFLSPAELAAYDVSDECSQIEGWFIADFVQGCRLDESCFPTLWRPLPSPEAE